MRRPRPAKRRLEVAFAWIETPSGVWLQQRPPTGLWAGLWQLPGLEGPRSRLRLAQKLDVRLGKRVATVRHELTHRSVAASVYRAADEPENLPDCTRPSRDPLGAPLSALARKAIAAVCKTGALTLLLALFASGCLYEELATRKGDRKVVVRAEDLADFVAEADPRAGTARLVKRKTAGGATALAYTFSDPARQISIHSTATVIDPGRGGSARPVYENALRRHRAVEDGEDGVRLVPMPLRLPKAEEASLFLVVKRGLPVGNVFLAWSGNVATDTRITGAYIDDTRVARRLVLPKFLRLARFDPDTSTIRPAASLDRLDRHARMRLE